ncbi:DNA primase [Candidatus Gracilibacteria bacterium]|nr:DNA primase [Candidatus Gracilibacteria bacterium]
MSQLTEDILSKIDIVDIVSKYIPLKRSGSNFAGLSPFKQEKTPSFMVSPHKQIFKDFSTGIGGNAITFIMEIEKIDFWDAIKILAKDSNIDLKQYELSSDRMKDFSDDREKIKRIHKLSQQYFTKELVKNQEALDYLNNKRGLGDDIIDKFGIGFSPDDNYGLIQFIKDKGFSDEDILQSSLAKKGQNTDSYSFFRNRIMFPIYDVMSNVVAFGARAFRVGDNPKYLNSGDHKAYDKSKILYGLNIAKQNLNIYDKLIVVEGYMDVIALFKLGFPIGVATCGTSLTEEHMKLLKRHTENVYFLFDNDEAGELATFRALKIAYAQNIFPRLIILPQGVKDIDELEIQEHSKDVFDNLLKNARDGFISYREMCVNKYDQNSPIDKQKFMNKMFELILAVDNYTIQDDYKRMLADKFGFAFEILERQFKKFQRNEGAFELKQKLNKVDDKFYQPDRGIIFNSLFYQKFIYKYIQDDSLRKGILDFVNFLGDVNSGSLINKVLKGEISEEEKKSFDEMHIWRETQLESLHDENKRYLFIKSVIGTILQSQLQLILKDKKFSDKQKSELLELKNNI